MAAFCVFSLLLLMSVCIKVFMHFCFIFVFMSVFVFVFLITHSCWFPPFSSFQLPPRPGHCSTSWLKTTITARSFFSLHTFCLLFYLYNQFLSTRRYKTYVTHILTVSSCNVSQLEYCIRDSVIVLFNQTHIAFSFCATCDLSLLIAMIAVFS